MNGWLGEWSEGSSASSANIRGRRARYVRNGPREYGPRGPHVLRSTDGSRDDVRPEMADLESKSGASFDRTWLTMMIAHHEGPLPCRSRNSPKARTHR